MSWTLQEYEEKKKELREAYREDYPLEEIEEKLILKRLIKDKEKDLISQVRNLADTKANKDTQLSPYIHCLFTLAH